MLRAGHSTSAHTCTCTYTRARVWHGSRAIFLRGMHAPVEPPAVQLARRSSETVRTNSYVASVNPRAWSARIRLIDAAILCMILIRFHVHVCNMPCRRLARSGDGQPTVMNCQQPHTPFALRIT